MNTFAPETQVRPTEPPRAVRYLTPLAAGIAATGVIGLAGPVGPLWGTLVGLVTFGALFWADITRRILDAGILVAAGIAGMSYFDWVLAGRSGPIDFKLSLIAAVGWVVYGAGTGFVIHRAQPSYRRTIIGAQAVAWGGGATLALFTATAMGVLAPLNARQISNGDIQELTIGLFIVTGLAAAGVGLGANFSFATRLPSLFASGLVLVVSVMAYNEIKFSTAAIATQLGRIGEIADDFWPPVWKWPKSLGQPDTFNIIEPFIETLQIAIIGAVTGNLLALPLAFYASRMTAPSNVAYRIAKGFLNVVRTIPDLVWGIFFATAVGFGNPFAGALAMIMFSLAIMAKLLSETVDAIDIGPLEAGRAAGARHTQVIQYGAFPQVKPNYVAYALYIFELNIRASVVIGFVGAGGIGRLLNERRNFFQWDQVMAIVLVIFVSVLLIEWFSIWARRKLV
ncbi:MAG: phosphonate ABC transporter, permease protein PhnE [Actinomycetia bacterium]|nr:phosphonate ABC transporter, permease protein PhnE [Actinomycetes bacterium]